MFKRKSYNRVNFSKLLSGNETLNTSKKRRTIRANSANVASSSSKGKEPDNTLDDPVGNLSDPEGLSITSLDKKIDIIQKQNSRIIKKIDSILSFQSNLETRIANLEEAIESIEFSRRRSNDKAFINVIKNL